MGSLSDNMSSLEPMDEIIDQVSRLVDGEIESVDHIIQKGGEGPLIRAATTDGDTYVFDPSRFSIDDGIENIEVNQDTNIVFLLGAGASVPSGIPAVEGLLEELMKRGRQVQNKDINNLVSFIDDRPINNIEDVLTAVYLSDFATRNRDVTSLVEYFLFSEREGTDEVESGSVKFLQETLQTLFGLLVDTMIPAEPNDAHEAIVEFSQSHDNTSIITTNYDGCMDEAILKTNLDLSGALEGGSEYFYPQQQTLEKTMEVISEQEEDDEIELIKMHGSINWAYCESCERSREFNLIQLKEFYEKDIVSYPVIGICPHCGGRRRPLLVPPISFKFLQFPPLVDMWKSARENIDKADYIITVGYSFADADEYLKKIVFRSLIENIEQKMIVIDTDVDLAPNIRDNLDAYGDVDPNRILQAPGDAEKMVPKILSEISQSELSDFSSDSAEEETSATD